jgi:hypothetical protein
MRRMHFIRAAENRTCGGGDLLCYGLPSQGEALPAPRPEGSGIGIIEPSPCR